jgi:hypothetical protein
VACRDPTAYQARYHAAARDFLISIPSWRNATMAAQRYVVDGQDNGSSRSISRCSCFACRKGALSKSSYNRAFLILMSMSFACMSDPVLAS